MDKVDIRMITKDDVPQLAELYNRVWPASIEHHLQKAAWAVNTTEYTGVCAQVNSELVGSRSCFHTNTYIGDKKIECVQVGDSCVDERLRGQGLFTKMNKLFLENYYKLGGELIYNFSVDASRKAYEKLGWKYIESMQHLFFINNPFRFLMNIIKGNKIVEGSVATKSVLPNIKTIPDELLEVREKMCMEMGTIHSRYDKHTLEWRISVNSGIRLLYLEGVGACLYKHGFEKGLRWCVIGEIFLWQYNNKNFKLIFKKLKKECPCDVINVSITLSHPLYRFYRKHLFLTNPLRKFLNHGVKLKDDVNGKEYLNPRNWALSTIDIDTF